MTAYYWPQLKNVLKGLSTDQLGSKGVAEAESIGSLALRLMAYLKESASVRGRESDDAGTGSAASLPSGAFDQNTLVAGLDAAFSAFAKALEPLGRGASEDGGISLDRQCEAAEMTSLTLGRMATLAQGLTGRDYVLRRNEEEEKAYQALIAAELDNLRFRYSEELTIAPLGAGEERPYDLLLSADPSRKLVDEYMERGRCFVARLNGRIVGEYVLIRTHPQTVEIVNVAVADDYQGRGIGKTLVLDAIGEARKMNARTVEIGTGSTGFAQLGLYQRCGFRVCAVEPDFFVRNYDEALYENGFQIKDMIRLRIEC